MSTTYKVILDKRRAKANGEFPVKLRIIQDGDYRDFSPHVSVKEAYWDDEAQQVSPAHPHAQDLNTAIDAPKNKLKKLLQLCELQDTPDPSLPEIIAAISRNGTTQKKPPKPSILEYGYQLAQRLQLAGNVGNGIVYTTALNRLKVFVGKDAFPFEQLTVSLLKEWESALLAEGLEVNSVSNYMRTIRAIYNQGIEEGLVSKLHYPFDRFTIKTKKTKSRSLPADTMRMVWTSPVPKAYMQPYRDLFLLSFSLIGINFSDLLTLKRDDVAGDRIVFSRKKTGKIYSIKIHPLANELFNRLHTGEEGYYLLPFLPHKLEPKSLKKKIALVIHCVNNAMKQLAKHLGIEKAVTTYYARYAWSNIARLDCGYSKDEISEALGHDYGNRVTGTYLDEYSAEHIDQMNLNVIEKVFSKKRGSV